MMLRKLAPTSNAANQMGEGGLTMQSFLHCRFPTKITQQRKSSIESEWNHVKYVFFDEVSMIGLDSITKLSRLMSIAREDWADSSYPFGGKNIVFFGDIMQFRPVMDCPVYADILDQRDRKKSANDIYKFYETDETQTSSTSTYHKYPKINNSLIRKRIGRAIWLQINTVVILCEQMRTTDVTLLGIQNRIREGIATSADHKILSSRVVKPGNALQSLSKEPWNAAPIIVFRNSLRSAINLKSVIRKSEIERKQLFVCVANDNFPQNSFQNEHIRYYALNLDDNKTQNLPGLLPLVEGI